MRVTALGSGDAFCSAGRGHTAWLVDDAQGSFAVDFGATALLALKRFFLVDAVYRAQRRAPLVVSGPAGTGQRLQALWAACYSTAAERPLPFPVHLRELSPGDEVELAGRRVRAFQAQHMTPPNIALALRIGKLAFTGDTGSIPEGLCEGAELLCAECTNLGDGTADHLGWRTLRPTLPRVPRILLAHLGTEARAGIAPPPGVRVCDDLDFVEL